MIRLVFVVVLLKIFVRSNMKLVVLLLAICVCASANQAGVHLLVAQSGLEMVKDIVMPFVGNSIDSLTVPDISGTSGS